MVKCTKGEPIIYPEAGTEYAYGFAFLANGTNGLALLASERPVLDNTYIWSCVGCYWRGLVMATLDVQTMYWIVQSLLAMWFVYCYGLMTGFDIRLYACI
jgi:hypothetical protein